MRVIELSIPEALIREGLPRATDEEVAFLVGRFAGRSLPPDNADLLRPFTDRDTPRDRVLRVQLLLGCLLTGRRAGWSLGMVSRSVERIVEAAAARA